MGSIAAGSEQAEGAGTGAWAQGREGAAGSIRFHRAIRCGAAGLLDATREVAAAHRLAAVVAGAIFALAAAVVSRVGVSMVAQAS